MQNTSTTRAALLGMLFAIVGFSYALATSTAGGSGSPGAAGRGVGTAIPLDFANAFSDGPGSDRDLGDAVAGSALTRIVRAKGGVPPYKFASSALNSLSNNTLQLFSNGLLTTVGTSVGNLGNPFRFSVTVTDSAGTNPNSDTETFRISFVTTSLFRFAQSEVGGGVRFRDYSEQLSVLNGAGAKTWVASNVQLNGAARASLEAVGLSLSNDGALFGKPLEAGTLTFRVEVTDANGAKALSRDGTTPFQNFSITIQANEATNSQVFATAISIKLDGSTTKESVTYSGLFNIAGFAISELENSPVQLHIGGFASQVVTLNEKGQAATPKGPKTDLVKASISSKGLVKFAASKTSVTAALGNITGTSVILSVELRIGSAVIGAESLRFDVKGTGAKKTLTYKLASGANQAGGFIITSVKSKASKTGGTAWSVGFVAIPASGDSFAGADSAIVSIGKNGIESTVTVTEKSNKISGKGEVITKLSMDGNKGKGSFSTAVLTAAQTNIPDAANAGTGPNTFSTNITVRDGATEVYQGEAAAEIFAKGTSYTNANPTK